MQLMTLHDMVLSVLEEVPATRSSDRVLIATVYERYYGVHDEPFYQVMEEMTDLPSIESITRVRRKIQEQREDLRAVKAVETERINRQLDFIEYAGGEIA